MAIDLKRKIVLDSTKEVDDGWCIERKFNVLDSEDNIVSTIVCTDYDDGGSTRRQYNIYNSSGENICSGKEILKVGYRNGKANSFDYSTYLKVDDTIKNEIEKDLNIEFEKEVLDDIKKVEEYNVKDSKGNKIATIKREIFYSSGAYYYVYDNNNKEIGWYGDLSEERCEDGEFLASELLSKEKVYDYVLNTYSEIPEALICTAYTMLPRN